MLYSLSVGPYIRAPMRSSLLLSALVLVVSCGKCGGESPTKQAVPFPDPAKATPQPTAPAKPNVVIVTIDTLRADHLPIYAYARDTAPNLRRLARTSVVYDNAFSAHTNTAPSHGSMLTGAFPGVHGIRQNGMKLSATVPTLAEVLHAQGYATGAFVTGWTLTPHTGLNRGFDVYDAQFPRSRRPGAEAWRIADRWLKKTAAKKTPFLLFFHMFEPHFPYDPPDEVTLKWLPEQTALTVPLDMELPGLASRKRLSPAAINEFTARYDAEITVADKVIGRLVRRLTDLQLLDNTLIIFTSDHGETLFERPWIADHGGRAYDEQTHVPMVVHFPQGEYRKKRVAAPVHHVDIMPTVLDVLGIPGPEGLPGRSLREVISNRKLRKDMTRPVFSHGRPEPSRVPEIRAALLKTGIITAVRLHPFKLIEYPMANGQYFQQLFNIETDPGETKNVAADHPEQVAALHAQLDAFRQRTDTADPNTPAPVHSDEIHQQLKALGYAQ